MLTFWPRIFVFLELEENMILINDGGLHEGDRMQFTLCRRKKKIDCAKGDGNQKMAHDKIFINKIENGK